MTTARLADAPTLVERLAVLEGHLSESHTRPRSGSCSRPRRTTKISPSRHDGPIPTQSPRERPKQLGTRRPATGRSRSAERRGSSSTSIVVDSKPLTSGRAWSPPIPDLALKRGIVTSIDYEFAGWFPSDDPVTDAMAVVADVIGAPNVSDTVEHGGLRVFADVPEDDERRELRELLGFEANLTLLFTPYGPDELFTHGQRAMLRSVAALSSRGVRGMLFGDLGSDESLILRADGTGLTLNESWIGWQGPPDLKPDIPSGYRVETPDLHPNLNHRRSRGRQTLGPPCRAPNPVPGTGMRTSNVPSRLQPRDGSFGRGPIRITQGLQPGRDHVVVHEPGIQEGLQRSCDPSLGGHRAWQRKGPPCRGTNPRTVARPRDRTPRRRPR